MIIAVSRYGNQYLKTTADGEQPDRPVEHSRVRITSQEFLGDKIWRTRNVAMTDSTKLSGSRWRNPPETRGHTRGNVAKNLRTKECRRGLGSDARLDTLRRRVSGGSLSKIVKRTIVSRRGERRLPERAADIVPRGDDLQQ